MPKIVDPNWIPKELRETLQCKSCNEVLPRSMFSPRGKTSTGSQKYDPRCKPCYLKFSAAKFKNSQADHQAHLRALASERKVKCEICSYDRYKGALDFHHKDPTDKVAEISDLIFRSTSLHTTEQMLIEEMNKCSVLCSNCHREVHGGVLTLP